MQIMYYQQYRFIIASRPLQYLSGPLERVEIVLEVQPFSDKQKRQFIKNWYLANEFISSRNVMDAHARARALEEAETERADKIADSVKSQLGADFAVASEIKKMWRRKLHLIWDSLIYQRRAPRTQ
jgi:radical SAM superfamily enzyme YgiQ (UPF0313 family)